MDVAVRELKAKLSAYLARAAEGEVLTVTDRGRPIAVIGPPLGSVDLSTAVADGWVTPATRTGLPRIARKQATGTVLSSLAEDRDE